MTRAVSLPNHVDGSQRTPGSTRRTHQIMLRVNDAELAELEHRRALTAIPEMSVFVRESLLTQRPPRAVAPELNRAAWLALVEHLALMQELAERLEGLAGRPRAGLTGLVGRGRLEETVAACLEELRAQAVAIQAVRRSLLGSDRRRR
jgi:hypothetical protein